MSTCNTSGNDGLQWQFEIDNGNTGVKIITDPLLDTEERAEERAMAELLRNSFATNSLNYSTHITKHILNKVIRVGGLNYIIRNITTTVESVKIVVKIGGVRYD